VTSSEPADDIAATAAEYATTASVDSVPDPVEDRLPLVLLDTIGVCLRGSDTDYIEQVASGMAALGRDTRTDDGSTVFATGGRRDVSQAALLNAAAGTTLELDEGNQRSAHPGIHTVVPALAAGEHLEVTGAELLNAILVGYEIGARLGDVIRPMISGLHPHGGWAAVSGAVAVGRLRRLDTKTMADAIRNAVNPFLVGHWQAAFDGATVRNFYTGLSCQHGIVAATLAEQGITGVHGAVEECLLPYTAAADVTDALLTPFDTFGDSYYLTSSYMKIHAACRYSHAPIEALAELQDSTGIDPDDVERVRVRTFELGTTLDRTDPDNVLSAKFSTPFALASRLYTGRSDAEAFTPDLVANDKIQALADRVELGVDEALESRASEGKWGATVTVELTDGTTHSTTKEDARGGGDTPFTREEIYHKFDSLVGTRLEESTASEFREELIAVASVDSVSSLLDPLH
jgi:2-methylcitrate dehydratase PrpD